MELFLNTFAEAGLLLVNPNVVIVMLIGAILGSIAGALPGITTTLAVSVTLPLSFVMSPEAAVAFLVAITVGVNYGNSIPAILVGVPGTPTAVLTAIDGYKLHMQGKSGLALGAQYFGGLVGQLISTVFFVALVVPLSQLLYVFLTPELWALHLLGMTAIVALAGKNVFKGLIAALFGLAVAMVGPDPVSLVSRFHFGVFELRGGFEVVPVVIGALAISELIRSSRQVYSWKEVSGGFQGRFPRWFELRRMMRPIGIGAVTGTAMGVIPGVGGTAGTFLAYQQAKMWSKHPEEFGEGSVEGIAANESAQNASQAGEMVPTFGFGIPGSGSMVLLLAALTVHGFVPGPLLIQETPEMLYAATAGLLGAVLVLAALGWPIARMLLGIVTINRSIVLTIALVLSIIGVYALRNSIFDVVVMLVFGGIGYFMLRYGYSTAAFALAVVLGGSFEGLLRRGILLTDSDWGQFFTRPITLTMVIISILLLVYGIVGTIRTSRRMRARVAATAAEQSATSRSVATHGRPGVTSDSTADPNSTPSTSPSPTSDSPESGTPSTQKDPS
ncbi:MAG: tripartite tricarboxylate transporter permease [Microcella sp.]|uniref:tripartite tricarboxylate transporter permease n=1 Tax=Microcella sp. TaxID=1913979 RepID=UPI003314B070